MTATHRRLCFEEYDRVCQSCGSTGPVDVHHIDGDETNNTIENLIPLCKSCHQKVHNGTADTETIAELSLQLETGTAPEFAPSRFDGVPNRATVTVKEVGGGNRYYYWQWRDGDRIRSEYICPADRDGLPQPTSTHQTALADWR